MRRLSATILLILASYLPAVARDFSSLPRDAQLAIKRALPPANVEQFTLTASDGQNEDGFGNSVAIDGDTIIVGSLYANTAYVFVKPKSGWANMTQTAKLTPANQGARDFGVSVAISGGTIVVGGADINLEQGVAYVFVKPAQGWQDMTPTAELTASDGIAASGFASSVSINGSTVVVGAPFGTNGDGGPGIAYVFDEPIGGWTDMTQTAELTASDGTLYNYFGESVSISANTILVGTFFAGYGGNDTTGPAYIFEKPPSGWVDMTQNAELISSDGKQGDGFGASVSLEGNTAVVGAPRVNNIGAVYVFMKPEGGWADETQRARLVAGGGWSVSISGPVILEGDIPAHRFTGRAVVFLKPKTGWQDSSKGNRQLAVNFQYGDDEFGASVSVSGRTGVVGAENAPTSLPCKGRLCKPGPGEAFVFLEK